MPYPGPFVSLAYTGFCVAFSEGGSEASLIHAEPCTYVRIAVYYAGNQARFAGHIFEGISGYALVGEGVDGIIEHLVAVHTGKGQGFCGAFDVPDQCRLYDVILVAVERSCPYSLLERSVVLQVQGGLPL